METRNVFGVDMAVGEVLATAKFRIYGVGNDKLVDEVVRAELAVSGANQYGKKTSVEADAYVKIQKSYASVIKQLTDLLPDSIETAAGTEIMAFLNSNE